MILVGSVVIAGGVSAHARNDNNEMAAQRMRTGIVRVTNMFFIIIPSVFVLLSYLFCTTMGKAQRARRTPLAVVADKYFGRVSPWQWSDSLPCLPLLVIPTDCYSPSMRSYFSRLVSNCVIS